MPQALGGPPLSLSGDPHKKFRQTLAMREATWQASAHKANDGERGTGRGVGGVGDLSPELGAAVEGRAGGAGLVPQQRDPQVRRHIDARWRNWEVVDHVLPALCVVEVGLEIPGGRPHISKSICAGDVNLDSATPYMDSATPADLFLALERPSLQYIFLIGSIRILRHYHIHAPPVVYMPSGLMQA